MNINPFQKYKSATVASSDPIRQLVFVFDEIIKLLYMSQKAIREGDYELKYKCLTRISDVFYLLRSGLKADGDEKENELVRTLDSFYEATIYNVNQLNLKAEAPEDVDKVIKAISIAKEAINVS